MGSLSIWHWILLFGPAAICFYRRDRYAAMVAVANVSLIAAGFPIAGIIWVGLLLWAVRPSRPAAQ